MALGLVCVVGGCTPYYIEYRDRPAYHQAANKERLPDRVTLPDGRVIVYRDRSQSGVLQSESRGQPGEPFKYREEKEDGTVVLRNVLPEHVMLNTLACLQGHEYDVIWKQLLAEGTRAAYQSREMDSEQFAEFFRKHRNDLAKTVNRMFHGLPRNEVVIDRLAPGTTRYRFVPQIGKQFKFRTVTITSEPTGLKLVMIE